MAIAVVKLGLSNLRSGSKKLNQADISTEMSIEKIRDENTKVFKILRMINVLSAVFLLFALYMNK